MKIDELKAKVNEAGLEQGEWPSLTGTVMHAQDCSSCSQGCQNAATNACSIGCALFLWGK